MKHKRRRMRAPQQRHRTAVGQAIAKFKALDELKDHITVVKVALYGAADGQDETQLLSHLGFVFGLVTEAELSANGSTPLARRMHGALRSVQAMCLNGYRWQAQQARPLEIAVDEALKLLTTLPEYVVPFVPSAQYLCDRIRHHQLVMGDVAGAEAYSHIPARQVEPTSARKGITA